MTAALSVRGLVAGYGGVVSILDYVSDHSTTAMIDRIRAAAPSA